MQDVKEPEGARFEGYWIQESQSTAFSSGHLSVIGIKRADNRLAATRDGSNWFAFTVDSTAQVNWVGPAQGTDLMVDGTPAAGTEELFSLIGYSANTDELVLQRRSHYRIPQDSIGLLLLRMQAQHGDSARAIDSAFVAFAAALSRAVTLRIGSSCGSGCFRTAIVEALQLSPELPGFVSRVDSSSSAWPPSVVIHSRNAAAVSCKAQLSLITRRDGNDFVQSSRVGASDLEGHEVSKLFCEGGTAFAFDAEARSAFVAAMRRSREFQRRYVQENNPQSPTSSPPSRSSIQSEGPPPAVLLACAREVDENAFGFSSGPEWRAALPRLYESPRRREALTTAYIRCINSYR